MLEKMHGAGQLVATLTFGHLNGVATGATGATGPGTGLVGLGFVGFGGFVGFVGFVGTGAGVGTGTGGGTGAGVGGRTGAGVGGGTGAGVGAVLFAKRTRGSVCRFLVVWSKYPTNHMFIPAYPWVGS